MSESSSDGFSDDSPVIDRADDQLNRAPFADRIIGVLQELPRGSSLVVGVHGPWGDGKTTVLNILRNDLGKNDSIVVRDFNPWRLIDDESMLRGFFTMLADAIGESLSTKKERTRAMWSKGIESVQPLVKSIAIFFTAADSLDRLLSQLGKAAANGNSVGIEELRQRVVARLSDSDRRIVVLVDDLDRLDKHEIHTLFRLIKACADFPNVSYVLAFDDVAVAQAIGEHYASGGEKSGRVFLEKVIQLPLRLPLAAKDDLRSMCLEHVDQALAAAKVELTQSEVGEFVTGFDLLSIRMTTPRAAKRFGNGLRFALPTLAGETNHADLLLAETLRAFFPEVYEIIKNNHVAFSGVEPSNFGGRQADDPRSKQLLDPVLELMTPDDRDAITPMLVSLFPRLASPYGRTNYGYDSVADWTRERRISSPLYCARYFTYAVPTDDIADADVGELVSSASAGALVELRSTIAPLLEGKKARRLIEKLRGVASDIEPAAAKALAIVISQLGSVIPNPPALMSFETPAGQAAILVSHLLKRVPSGTERVGAAIEVMMAAEPLWFAAECLRWLNVTDKPEKQDANALNEAETSQVRAVLVDRIKAHVATGATLFEPETPENEVLLWEWWRGEGREPIQEHLLSAFARDPRQIGLFLRAMAGRGWSSGDVVPHVSDLDGRRLKNMKYLIDLDVLASLVREHCPGNLDNPEWSYDQSRSTEQRLAEEFIFVYNKWQAEGEPPDEGDTEVLDSQATSPSAESVDNGG